MPRKALWVEAWAYKQARGFNSIHLVLPNLYGPGDHFDPIRSHALGALIQKVVDASRSGAETVEIWGTGRPIREWGFVSDAAEGIIRAMEKYDDIEILNIGQGKGYSVTEIAEMIRDAVGWKGEFVYDPSKPDGAPKKILDVEKMKRVLGWEPRMDIRQGIRETVAWYQEEVKKN
jgi:GDP-L-fucose synthase